MKQIYIEPNLDPFESLTCGNKNFKNLRTIVSNYCSIIAQT